MSVNSIEPYNQNSQISNNSEKHVPDYILNQYESSEVISPTDKEDIWKKVRSFVDRLEFGEIGLFKCKFPFYKKGKFVELRECFSLGLEYGSNPKKDNPLFITTCLFMKHLPEEIVTIQLPLSKTETLGSSTSLKEVKRLKAQLDTKKNRNLAFQKHQRSVLAIELERKFKGIVKSSTDLANGFTLKIHSGIASYDDAYSRIRNIWNEATKRMDRKNQTEREEFKSKAS